jgi:hypothetical protein
MEKLKTLLLAVGIAIATAVLLAWPTQWLWNNALVGAVDGAEVIGLWQALGINILCNLLFKGHSSSRASSN